MQIIYYKDAIGNFGDDLNELIWPNLLPQDVRDAPDVVLVGIGSLLDRERLADLENTNKRVFVLGTGAAYGAAPVISNHWNFLAVRGPLTASVIGRPDAAITDGAALLARLPKLTPVAEQRNEILFMPHHGTLVNSRWAAAAERAGLTFVDPQGKPDDILAQYGRAKLVVTEAMHGAIVADTLRIPWIPTMISPEISIFKWRDWASSLALTYKPVALPPTTRLETLRYQRMSRLTMAGGRSIANVDAAAMSDDELLLDYRQRSREQPEVIGPVQAPGGLKTVVKRFLSFFDERQIDIAAAALKAVASGESYLSRDDLFADRLGQLEAATNTMIDQVRAG